MKPEIDGKVVAWLMAGDPSIRWHVLNDLTGASKNEVEKERQSVAAKGWGAKLLSLQDPEGTWGGGLYSPKWISTTYTLLLLRRMGTPPNRNILKACKLLIDKGIYNDGGINFSVSYNYSETCITGLVLSILSSFKYDDPRISNLAEHLLKQQMEDGGWNCRSYLGDKHSSVHTTINVLEGLREYQKNYPQLKIIGDSQRRGREFLLNHRLYKSHRTGKVFDPKMTRFTFPVRWRYDILRALDYFRECDAPKDERMNDAIKIILKRQTKDGRWLMHAGYPGRTFFELEKTKQPSRWNTLRAYRVLKWWNDIQ